MTTHLKPVKDQVVLLTGPTSGIGLATARAFARAGAKVMLVSRDETALRRLLEEITAAGGSADYAVADVADPDAVMAAGRKAVDVFGRIDTWINNAGTSVYGFAGDTPIDEHRRLFDTNYFGVVNGCSAAISLMRNTGGAIISMGSIGSDLPEPAGAAYAASKHAVAGYVESFRMEVESQRLPLSITLLKPSGIDTPFAQRARNHGDGEAVVPRPTYAPDLVVRTILHAAAHPCRTVVVGGGGRALMTLRRWAPRVLDRATPVTLRLLFDRTRGATPTDALFAPVESGQERSGLDRGRSWSVYTTATLHPWKAAGVASAAIGTAALLFKMRRRADQ